MALATDMVDNMVDNMVSAAMAKAKAGAGNQVEVLNVLDGVEVQSVELVEVLVEVLVEEGGVGDRSPTKQG